MFAATCGVMAQADPQNVVEAERAFASLAAQKGTKLAFLANMTDDAVVFIPARVNAKENWTARTASASLLSWAPNFADISSDGSLGYTTGNWEFRAKGKDDTPSAFGEFITVWKLQPGGQYKWVVDIGISHDKPKEYLTKCLTPVKKKASVKQDIDAGPTILRFIKMAEEQGSGAAYERFGDEDARSFRDGQTPFVGRQAILSLGTSDHGKIQIDAAAKPIGSSDIVYFLSGYNKKLTDGKTEKGNVLQIWKYRSRTWRLVLDIVKPVETK